MKLVILLCDTFPGLLPPYIPSYEWMFVRLFGSVRPDLEFGVVPTWRDVLPPRLDPGALYLITGSNSDAYDVRTPWIIHLRQWTVQAHEAGVRLAGICFGHQLIAHALGGRAARHPGGWGTGIRPSHIISPELARAVGGNELRLMYNHHDQVVQLPPGAQLLSTSAFCPNEAFTLGKRTISFQGHPEYLKSYARHLLLNHAESEDPAVRQTALDSLDRWEHHGTEVARFILDFLK